MNKLLYVHNLKIKKDHDGNLYTHISYNDKIWERYQNICCRLSVVGTIDRQIYSKEYCNHNFSSLKNLSIDIIIIPNLFSPKSNVFNLKLWVGLFSLLKEAVVSNDGVIARVPSLISIIALYYVRRTKRKNVVEVVGCPLDVLWNYSIFGKLLALPSYLLMKHAIRRSKNVVYVTERFLQKRYPNFGVSINCSNVSIKQTDESILQRRLERIMNLKLDKPLAVSTIGAVDVKYKGQEYVIKAISELIKLGIEFEYHIIGGGNPARLQKLTDDLGLTAQIRFIGSLSHENIMEYLDSIDIYIQPSNTEGLPRALVEAMSRGCPCLGASVGGIPELLQSQYLFKKRNIKQIISHLQGLSKEKMTDAAKSNFHRSLQYQGELIEKRRNDYLNIVFNSDK